LKNYIDQFINEVQNGLSKSTVVAYENALGQFEKWFSDKNDIEFEPKNITLAHIKEFKQHLMALNRTPKTINKLLTIVTTFLNWAVDKKIIELNPASSVKGIKQEKELPRWLNEQELKAVLNELNRDNNIRNKLVIMLILCAGLQVNEVSELKVADLEILENEMYLNVGNRNIPVNKALQEALIEYLNEVGKTTGYLLFSFRSTQLSVRGIQHIIKEYGNKANIDNLTAISLRHTFGYKLGLTGTDPYTIAVLMGYTTGDNLPNIKTAMQYITDWNKLQEKLTKNMKEAIDNLT